MWCPCFGWVGHVCSYYCEVVFSLLVVLDLLDNRNHIEDESVVLLYVTSLYVLSYLLHLSFVSIKERFFPRPCCHRFQTLLAKHAICLLLRMDFEAHWVWYGLRTALKWIQVDEVDRQYLWNGWVQKSECLLVHVLTFRFLLGHLVACFVEKAQILVFIFNHWFLKIVK